MTVCRTVAYMVHSAVSGDKDGSLALLQLWMMQCALYWLADPQRKLGVWHFALISSMVNAPPDISPGTVAADTDTRYTVCVDPVIWVALTEQVARLQLSSDHKGRGVHRIQTLVGTTCVQIRMEGDGDNRFVSIRCLGTACAEHHGVAHAA